MTKNYHPLYSNEGSIQPFFFVISVEHYHTAYQSHICRIWSNSLQCTCIKEGETDLLSVTWFHKITRTEKTQKKTEAMAPYPASQLLQESELCNSYCQQDQETNKPYLLSDS